MNNNPFKQEILSEDVKNKTWRPLSYRNIIISMQTNKNETQIEQTECGSGEKSLILAALSEDWIIFEDILNYGVELDLKSTEKENTLAIIALRAGQIDVAWRLVKKKQIIRMDEFKEKVVSSLVSEGKWDILQKILKEFLLVGFRQFFIIMNPTELNPSKMPLAYAMAYQFYVAILNNKQEWIVRNRAVLASEILFIKRESMYLHDWVISKAIADLIIDGEYKKIQWIFDDEKIFPKNLLNHLLFRGGDTNSCWNHFVHYILIEKIERNKLLLAIDFLSVLERLVKLGVNPANRTDEESLLAKFKRAYPGENDLYKQLDEIQSRPIPTKGKIANLFNQVSLIPEMLGL